MRRLFMVLFASLAVVFTSAAQNNPYEIDDECYRLFTRAELLLGSPEFKAANDSLMHRAIACGDKKSQTLFYVERMKHLSRLSQNDKSVTDQMMVAAAEELRQVALELGYKQYYYYSYDLLETYYYRKGEIGKTIATAKQLLDISIANGDEYGRWMSSRFMISLYLEMNDYVSARKAAFTAIDAFEKSNDPTVRRQSICRTYYDLADTYPVGSDSMRLYVNRGITETKLHLDTLRCRYYLAVLAALDKENRKYRNLRDYCAADPMLPTISRYGPAVFSIIDDIVSGHIDNQTIETAQKIESTREMKFVANVAEAYGQDALAFTLEKMLVVNLESKLSDVNQMRFLELSADLDNLRLHADLDKRSAEVTRWSSIATWLVALILVAVLAFTFIEMRNMRRRRNSDAKMIADLRVANEKVRLADAAKTRFVQNMSHEVRTPLNAIVGFSQLLALPDGCFPPEEKDEFAGHIVNNTKMLTMLLDDILNASAMDNGKYRIQLEEGELHFMGRAAISSSEHRLQPGVTMDYSSDRESPFTFVTDPRRVQQILINLLTNACKHTSSGHIDLNSRVDSKRGMVVYTVTDTGTGVPPEMAEAIFDRFTKLNDFVQGTGLGLSICRDIASRMGARVYLDTTYTEGGARFVFELPIVPPEIN